jgi:CcmD family protein
MDTRNFTYMFYGFLAAWLILAGYLLSLAARERKIKRQLESLKRMIEDREQK